MKGSRWFVVGRRTRRCTLVVMVRDSRPPIPGPFILKAVVAASGGNPSRTPAG